MRNKIKNAPKEYKISVLMTFVWGLLTHGFAMTNALMYHDGLLVERVGATYVSGRWFLGLLGEKGLIGKLFGTYNMPFLQGMLLLVLLACANILILDVLEIRSCVSCALLSGVLVVFPTIISLFGYVYTMDYYGIAVLLAVAAVWIAVRCKHVWSGLLLSVVCMVLSLGIYQAYIGIALTLFMIVFMKRVLQSNEDRFQDQLLTGVRYVGILGISYVGYMIINKLFVHFMHVQMVDYQNLNSMGHITLDSLKQGIRMAYKDMIRPNPELFPQQMRYAYYVCIFLIGLLCLYAVIRKFRDKRYMDIVWIVLVLVLLPLGLNSIYLAGALWVYDLMMYSMAMLFFVPFVFLEAMDKNRLRKVCVCASCLVTAYTCIFYMTYGNRCYMDAALTQQKTISWMNQLIAQIKATPGYRDDLQIVFFDEPVEDASFSADTEYNVAITHYGNFDVRNSYNWTKFMRKWCGFEMQSAAPEVCGALLQRPDVQGMPSYPQDGSIRIFDDVIVVRY